MVERSRVPKPATWRALVRLPPPYFTAIHRCQRNLSKYVTVASMNPTDYETRYPTKPLLLWLKKLKSIAEPATLQRNRQVGSCFRQLWRTSRRDYCRSDGKSRQRRRDYRWRRQIFGKQAGRWLEGMPIRPRLRVSLLHQRCGKTNRETWTIRLCCCSTKKSAISATCPCFGTSGRSQPSAVWLSLRRRKERGAWRALWSWATSAAFWKPLPFKLGASATALKAMLRVIAILLNGTVISEEVGLSLWQSDLDDLGRAGRIEIGKETPSSSTASAARPQIEARVAGNPPTNQKPQPAITTKKKLQERVAKLAGGVAVIKVGAATEVEMKEKRPRGRRAARYPRSRWRRRGCGRQRECPVRAPVPLLENLRTGNAVRRRRRTVVLRAVESRYAKSLPLRAAEPAWLWTKCLRRRGNYVSYNAGSGECGDMIEMGVLGPAVNPFIAATRPRLSCGLMLTTGCMVLKILKTSGYAWYGGMGGIGGMM